MGYLIAASVLWSFSFGLINRQLADLAPAFTASARLFIALAVALPFLRIRLLRRRVTGGLLAIGAVQYGLMYLLYMRAFRYLEGHEIALLTVTTPILVVLIDDGWRGCIRLRNLVAALLATLGCAYLRAGAGLSLPALQGMVLVQSANACFAAGQVGYRYLMGTALDDHSGRTKCDVEVFGLLYLGGALTAGLAAWATGGLAEVPRLTPAQVLALVYLGTIPSGLAFLLWNMGARRVSGGVLACMNNLKIPLAVTMAVLVFSEKADWERIVVAFAALTLATWAAARN